VILLVEDDPDDVELTRLALAERRIPEEVVVVRDGAEAISFFHGEKPAVSENREQETIVLLDINLPKIDGFEVCRRIRSRETDRPPYIIMLTAKDTTEDVVKGLEAGADDYLPKPFDPAELRARIGVGRRILVLRNRMAEKIEKLQEALDALASLRDAAAFLNPTRP